MRTRFASLLLVLVVALALPAAAAADSPRVYHGTWDTAGWTYDPETCPFPPEVPASGNWNVTIVPGQAMAVVHVTIFSLGMHIDSWGGRTLGEFWTVDSASSTGFALHADVPAMGNTAAARFTFSLDQGRLTFSIAPWVLLNPDGSTLFACAAAVSSGPVR
jgi:opacity protein-like surface antigen